MSITKIFDTLLEPVFILNTTGGFNYCNNAATLICDLSERKILKSNRLEDIFKFSEEISWLNSLSKITDSTPYLEVHFQTHSGKSGKAQITAQPFQKINDLETVIIYFRDVTLEITLQTKYRAELEQKEKYIKDLENARNELENYSKNLEKMVSERTFEIQKLNNTMSALLDSLDQGFFLFDKNGLCLSVASKACHSTIECNPVNHLIWDVLKVPKDRIDGFKKWMLTMFADMLPFEDLSPLGPNTYNHSEGKHIHLNYYPLLDSQGTLEAIVVVATDTTHLDHAKKEAEQEKSFAKMVIGLIRRKKEITQFILETKHLFNNLNTEINFLKTKNKKFSLEALLRHLHTLKGGAAIFSLSQLSQECHQAEEIASMMISNEKPPEIVDTLEHSIKKMNFQFDSFLKDNQIILGASAVQGIRTVEIPVSEIKKLSQDLSRYSETKNLSKELETNYLLTKIDSIFQTFDDVIIQTANLTDKKINPIQIIGGNIPIVEKHYSELFASLIHQFRNAVDHGIEDQDQRIAKGKPASGTITVYTQIEAGHRPLLKIEISDDGKGIDPQIIRSKLLQKGIETHFESDEQVIQHVFDSQFSTRSQVTETSGRGIGMDAIRIATLNMGGTVWIQSELGKGTRLIIKVPYYNTEILAAA